MSDAIILGLVGALIVIIVYYLTKQRQCHGDNDFCAGCSEHKNSCSKCDVETLKKELKEQLHKSS